MENEKNYFVGKRKNAVCVVKAAPGTGKIVINGRGIEDYFKGHEAHLAKALVPLKKCDCLDKFDITAEAKGGGMSGQAQALRHGIALALAAENPAWKKLLKKDGLLYRDPRVVERKKPGRPKARKRFQYSKR